MIEAESCSLESRTLGGYERGMMAIAYPKTLIIRSIGGRKEPERRVSQQLEEYIATAIASLPEIRILAGATAQVNAGTIVLPASIALESTAGYVVQGEIASDADLLLVRVGIVDVVRGHHIWQGEYRVSPVGISGPLQEIAHHISRLLGTCEESSNDDPALAAARTEYLTACHFRTNLTAPSQRKAVAHFREAVRLCPEFTLAMAGESTALFLLALELNDRELSVLASRRANAALRRGPKLAEALTTKGALAMVFDRDSSTAMACFDEAIHCNPWYSLAEHLKGILLSSLGESKQAIESFERAIGIDPFLMHQYRDYGYALLCAGEIDRAVEQFHRAIGLGAPHFGAHLGLGLCRIEQRKIPEAIACFRHEPGGYKNLAGLDRLMIGISHARAGHPAPLQRLLESDEIRYLSPTFRGLGAIEVGDSDAAAECFRDAAQSPDGWLNQFIRSPMARRYRGSKWYREVLQLADLGEP